MSLIPAFEIGIWNAWILTVFMLLTGMILEVPVSNIFKGVAPFLSAVLACDALIVAFPQIVTSLPNLIIK